MKRALAVAAVLGEPLSAAGRRKLHRRIQQSTSKCAECREPCRYWHLIKGVPTCPVCGGTRPIGGSL